MNPVVVSPEVRAALEQGEAVVALESTILCHGFPPSERRALAAQMQDAIRSEGAVPATVAVVDGEVCAGLLPSQMERLLSATDVAKCSARDVALVATQGRMGATTVAATMMVAARAGIEVFATGGIGGVHRGGETSLDISADLAALAEFALVVVSAGAKSLLDLPRTLELLETRGVPVVGYRTNTFPSFYSVDSGLSVPHRVDSPQKVAAAFSAQRDLGLRCGLLLCNPPPLEVALERGEVDAWLDVAFARAAHAGLRGAEVTPFILSQLAELSDGRSVVTNRALALHNAVVAAQVARSLSDLRRLA